MNSRTSDERCAWASHCSWADPIVLDLLRWGLLGMSVLVPGCSWYTAALLLAAHDPEGRLVRPGPSDDVQAEVLDGTLRVLEAKVGGNAL